jgi:hypothetical protein
VAALNDPKIRRKLENYIEEPLKSPTDALAGVVQGQPHGGNFNLDVHNWNPNVPVWRRSPKE